ncbi:PAS domain-containing protein [Halovulum sp. GXIMD14793]
MVLRPKMTSDILQNLRSYWDSLRDGRLAPFRAELDPRQFEDALENMFILEQLNPTQLRVRLAGMALCEMMGMEVRGMPPEAMMAADNREAFSQHLNTVLNTPAVMELQLTATGGDGQQTNATMLLLPLRSDFGEVTRVLGCVVTEERIAAAPVHFAIQSVDQTVVRDVTAEPPAAVPGFAEDSAPFRHPDSAPTLRSVQGNSDESRRSEPRRGHLRIIVDND